MAQQGVSVGLYVGFKLMGSLTAPHALPVMGDWSNNEVRLWERLWESYGNPMGNSWGGQWDSLKSHESEAKAMFSNEKVMNPKQKRGFRIKKS